MKIDLKKFKLLRYICVTLAGLYLFVLVLPYVINPFISKYSNDIASMVKSASSLDCSIDGFGVTLSPKLHAGVRFNKFSLKVPNQEFNLFSAQNLRTDLKIFPLILKKIEFGKISAKKLDLNLSLNNNGDLDVIDFFNSLDNSDENTGFLLPYNLKLSNKLPDILINKYNLRFHDDKIYSINGKKFRISNFIIDKNLNLRTLGQIKFGDEVVSNYNIKLRNTIMPDIDLNELLLSNESLPDDSSENKNSDFNLNFRDIIKNIEHNKFKADINADIGVFGSLKSPKLSGKFDIYGVTSLINSKQLAPGYLKLKFKGNKIDIDSNIYTSDDETELTKISGIFKFGQKCALNLALKSNAKINNIIRLADTFAKIMGKDDLNTLTGSGSIDADLNLKTDLKKVVSNGYLKIPTANLRYGLYNININNIFADVNFDNNNLNIKDICFSILNNPLKIKGTISEDTTADIKIAADKIPIKGLFLLAGQKALLDENDINSGDLSLNAILKGKLADIKPDISLNLSKINIFNKPLKAKVLLDNAFVKLLIKNAVDISGDIEVKSLSLLLNGSKISIPSAQVTADSNDIKINNSKVLLGNSGIDVKGLVTNYLNDKLNMDITAQGSLSSYDLVSFIPKEFRTFFPYKGSLPVKITAKGNQSVQDICFNLAANPSNYLQVADINLLRGKNTKIHMDMKIAGNSLRFENSGVFADSKQIATFGGYVNNFSAPRLNLYFDVPQNISFPIWGLKNSNITAQGAVDILGTIDNPKLKGKVGIADLSDRDMDFAISDMVAHFDGSGISGNATAEKFKFGGITATKLSSDFSLKNYEKFYLNNLSSTAYEGKVDGNIYYNIPKFAFGIDLIGKNLNSTDAVYASTGIKKALTGKMGFHAKLSGSGVTEIDIIKSLKGNVDFDINDGRFISIGKLENLVAAQNVTSISLLKSAISALTTLSSIQQTDKFKSIEGSMTLSGGIAKLSKIIVSGPLMSYYVAGDYNILKNTANLYILGRLDQKIITYLGPLGQLSVEKLLLSIPGLGDTTKKYIQILTKDPATEKVELIPNLTTGSMEYRDFKVIHNGIVGSPSAVKSFKWLSKCDTSQLDLKKELQNSKQAVKSNIESQVNSAKTTVENVKTNVENIVNTQKQAVQNEKKSIEQAKIDIQNIKQNASQNASNLSKILINAGLNAGKKVETKQEQQEQIQEYQAKQQESSPQQEQEAKTTDLED